MILLDYNLFSERVTTDLVSQFQMIILLIIIIIIYGTINGHAWGISELKKGKIRVTNVKGK